MSCNETDFLFPLSADIYYPQVIQTPSGKMSKSWTIDRTVVLNATPVGGAGAEDIRPETFVQYEGKLIGRVKQDIRIPSTSGTQAPTNILITNIRTCYGEILYKETAGPRSGYGTIYEVATFEPFLNPFGQIEYYKVLLRKTDNQILLSNEESS